MLNRLNRLRLRHLGIAILSAVLIGLLWQSDEKRGIDPAADLRGPQEPDSFVVNGEYRSFAETGQLSAVISSPRVEQFDEQSLADMEAPRARLIDVNTGLPWTLRANEGRYQLDSDIVRLSGDVVITRTLPSGSQGELKTPHLTLDNDKRIVHTDAPVVLTDPHGVTRATGMQAWIDERIMELKSQVEGQYEAPSNR
ncbi:LPS export ABC transporter periplasmic protein LptC [Marinobacter fonticola]|uniref:LPS export ABC transporter periplasmic protein LptC n=1 Tax=Marinobacter fonticola TaxID=2603215 RepID=UPI0011E816ED|nr:LPS export ABC transporter periplasmic protein LptC [Marinobacter fonticola]